MNYFNSDNCSFSAEQMNQANDMVASLLANWGRDDAQAVQSACDIVNNEI